MSKKMKDTDYAFISAYLRADENMLVSRERLERMIDAPTMPEAMRQLEECGYGDMNGITLAGLEKRLAARRAEKVEDISHLIPVPALVDVFRIRYDYHNAKTLVKAEAMGMDASPLLSAAGRFTPDEITAAFRGDESAVLTETLSAAMADAKTVLAETRDPQLADFALDKAYFDEMRDAADAVGSPLLAGYVRLNIDAVNLRTAVRVVKMGKSGDVLNRALIPGGSVSPDAILGAWENGQSLAAIYDGELSAAAKLGDSAAEGGDLTAFERECDNAIVAYMSAARSKPFGEEVPIGYLFALESEISAVRTVVSGRLAGLAPEKIRGRLRELYV